MPDKIYRKIKARYIPPILYTNGSSAHCIYNRNSIFCLYLAKQRYEFVQFGTRVLSDYPLCAVFIP